MILIEPVIERAEEYFALCIEYALENSFPFREIKTIEDARIKIQKDIEIQNDIEVEFNINPDDKIRLYVYWALSDHNEIIGSSVLCANPNKRLLKKNGHIGYDIRPKYRKQGSGTEILRLTLIEAYKKGLMEVLICCNDDNIGSRKVIENNNGKLVKMIIDEKSKKEIRRYRVPTSVKI